jgi:hypothetical protein
MKIGLEARRKDKNARSFQVSILEQIFDRGGVMWQREGIDFIASWQICQKQSREMSRKILITLSFFVAVCF